MLKNMHPTIVFIGQAPPKPGSAHDIAGAYLYPWLTSVGASEEWIAKHCHFYALTNEFPGAKKGSHLAPTPEAIAIHLPFLISQLQKVSPTHIVPVGKLAITSILGHTTGNLAEIIGQEYSCNPYNCLPHSIPTIPLPHPSGRSTWIHTHRVQLDQALEKLRVIIAS
jgi:uracil-DNA glycosylase